jgi:hypothetical protein
MANELDYDFIGRITARITYAAYVLPLVSVGMYLNLNPQQIPILTMYTKSGIHLFMSIYGLVVFLETPKHLREGRRRYIFISFFITLATILHVSLDVYWIFDMLFHATTPINFLEIAGDHYRTWGRITTISVLTAVISVGDFLLVRDSLHSKCLMP